MLLSLLCPLLTFAAGYEAQRDPPVPEVKKQYRLVLRTPGRLCNSWRKVTPQLGKDDMLVSASRRDEEDKGCRFLWIISPAEPAAATRFELEPFGGGAKESFELAAPAGAAASAPAPAALSPAMNIPGVANENGTGPADVPVKGKLSLPGGLGVDSVKPPPPAPPPGAGK